MLIYVLLILCVVLAAVIHVAAKSKGRLVTELIVDGLYDWATFWGCLAESVDAGLVRFRQVRRSVSATHVPMYLQTREE